MDTLVYSNVRSGDCVWDRQVQSLWESFPRALRATLPERQDETNIMARHMKVLEDIYHVIEVYIFLPIDCLLFIIKPLTLGNLYMYAQ